MKSIALNRKLLQYVLQRADADDLGREILSLIEQLGGDQSPDLVEAILEHIETRYQNDGVPAALLDAFNSSTSPLARWVRARLLAKAGDVASAVAAFGDVLQTLPAPEPHVLFQRARLLARQGLLAEAIADVQLALQMFPPYSFFVRTEKLVRRLMGSEAWTPRRRVKAALLSSSTTALLAPVLRSVGFRRGVDFDIYQGAYGNYQQDILDAGSGLYRFRPDFVFLLINHRDLDLGPDSGPEEALKFCSSLRNLWGIVQERNPCHVIQVGLDMPGRDAWGCLEDSLPTGRRRATLLANLALSDNLPAGVSFLDVTRIASETGPQFCSDLEWCTAKQHPGSAALPLLADHLCAHAIGALGLACKVLVVDLDNTLWGGIIGEDGLGGIRIGPPTAEGEGYRELQKYIKELEQRGVVLAACSKNNPDDAKLPFREHDGMILRLDDFAAFVANWHDKPGNLEMIASELSLGLDSVVFLDDSPMERALVRSRLPQVVVPECGQTPWEMLAALRRGLYFESTTLTKEDLARSESYQQNVARKSLERQSASLEEFLSGLKMVAEHGAVSDRTLPRVTQLINKTNQFNLTARRYTEEQVRAMATSPHWWCRWFKLSDRFGDHGLIGVILAEKSGPSWRVDTWLMSCRVLGRGIEQFMCDCLMAAAREEDAIEIVGEYTATERNTLVRDLYQRLGFRPCSEDGSRYSLDPRSEGRPRCPFIRESREDHETTGVD